MARWYRTASPQYQDFMYELPQEAILKAVQTADAGITANAQSNEALKGLLKLQAVKKDQPDANRILTGYETQINSLAKEIQSDPLQFRRKSSKLGDLQRTIARDFQSGDAAMIQGNYNTRLSNYEAMKEDYKKNPENYNYQDIEKLQDKLDNTYGGYKTGAYGVDRLREFVDLKEFDKLGKDYAAELVERTGAFKGADGYLYTSESRDKRVDPNQIKKDLVGILTSDKKLNDYYRQQIELGNITEEDYIKNLADTANRIGEKYGFIESKSGLTSIKNDDISTQEAVYLLANSQTNATPDVIAAGDTIVDKYVDNNAGTVDPYTINGMTNVINTVSGKIQSTKNMATSLAKENGITIPVEYARQIQQGNFAVLKNLKGANGEKISNQEIYKLQQEYDSYNFDRRLMQQKVEIASKQKDPNAWLEKSRKSNIEVIGDFQKYRIVSKADQVQFTKGVTAVQKELDETQAWYSSTPLTFSSEDLSKLPANIKAELRNGMTVNELISSGDIKVKQSRQTIKVKVPKMGADGKPILGAGGQPLMVTEERTNTNPTSEYEGFKVNAKHAKPTITPNGEGKSLWQFEINYKGHPIQTYIEDKNLSNKGLDRFMNKDAMKAAYQFRKAQSEGVIDAEGFNISGVEFKEVNGRIVAKTPSGTVPAEDAIQMIGNFYKNQREKTLR